MTSASILLAVGPDRNPYPREKEYEDRSSYEPPRWWRVYWPIVTSMIMFGLGLVLGWLEVSQWGARPQVLVLVVGLLLGPGALTALLPYWQRK